MEQQLYELLRQCTVRVSVQGKKGHGTGFFVAPGLILTCAHVVTESSSKATLAEIYWNEQSYLGHILPAVALAMIDLAFLEVEFREHPCVFLDKDIMLFDPLVCYGYPDNYPDGDTSAYESEGWSQDQQLF